MFDKFLAQQFNKNCSPRVAGWNLQFRVLGKNYKTDSYGSCNQSFCNAKIRQLKRDILLNCKFHLYYICFYGVFEEFIKLVLLSFGCRCENKSSRNIVLDLRRVKRNESLCIREIQNYLNNSHIIEKILTITKERSLIDMRKKG